MTTSEENLDIIYELDNPNLEKKGNNYFSQFSGHPDG